MYKLAAWLAGKGAARNRLTWSVLYYLWPTLAGMTATLTEALSPENQLIWWYSHDDNGESLQAVMDDIAKIVNRAPAPMGLDTYCIALTSLGIIPGEDIGNVGVNIDDTLDLRQARSTRTLYGDRWHDWKRGTGQDDARNALSSYRPNPDTPVTLIQIAVTGAGVVNTIKAICRGFPKVRKER